MMENSTQKLESPVESPKIFGPITFPSSCWIAKMAIAKYRACNGLLNIIKIIQGMAPTKGPKKGTTLVTPMITETNRV